MEGGRINLGGGISPSNFFLKLGFNWVPQGAYKGIILGGKELGKLFWRA